MVSGWVNRHQVLEDAMFTIQKMRSLSSSRTRLTSRFKMLICCRRTRFSRGEARPVSGKGADQGEQSRARSAIGAWKALANRAGWH